MVPSKGKPIINSSKNVDENGEPLVVYHGSEEDFNVFDKTRGFERGLSTYINKNKALDYLHLSTPIVAASNNEELDSAAKVIKNFGVVFFRTQQGMFSAAQNKWSRFKLDVRRNMARYVLSNSKPFGLLPKTLPHSANFSLRSRDNFAKTK